MKPYTHAKNSAREFGGRPEDYQRLHDWFDQTKMCLPDMRHRAVLHNAFGIYLCEQVFGATMTTSDGNVVSVRDVGERHVLEDLGTIPTLQDCLRGLPLSDLLGARLRAKKRWIPID
jgi:hypothetical protein